MLGGQADGHVEARQVGRGAGPVEVLVEPGRERGRLVEPVVGGLERRNDVGGERGDGRGRSLGLHRSLLPLPWAGPQGWRRPPPMSGRSSHRVGEVGGDREAGLGRHEPAAGDLREARREEPLVDGGRSAGLGRRQRRLLQIRNALRI